MRLYDLAGEFYAGMGKPRKHAVMANRSKKRRFFEVFDRLTIV